MIHAIQLDPCHTLYPILLFVCSYYWPFGLLPSSSRRQFLRIVKPRSSQIRANCCQMLAPSHRVQVRVKLMLLSPASSLHIMHAMRDHGHLHRHAALLTPCKFKKASAHALHCTMCSDNLYTDCMQTSIHTCPHSTYSIDAHATRHPVLFYPAAVMSGWMDDQRALFVHMLLPNSISSYR